MSKEVILKAAYEFRFVVYRSDVVLYKINLDLIPSSNVLLALVFSVVMYFLHFLKKEVFNLSNLPVNPCFIELRLQLLNGAAIHYRLR